MDENIKNNLSEILFVNAYKIDLIQCRVQWWAVVNVRENLWVLQKAMNFFTG
jgi:hypothetical protein